MNDDTPVLELRAVVGHTALGVVGAPRPLDLVLKRGQVGVILGGKETGSLFRLIMGLGTIDSGEIRLSGAVAADSRSQNADLLALRQRVGFAFRDKGLLSNLSLHDNVDLPAKYHGFYRSGAARGSYADRALAELGISRDLWNLRPSRISNELRKRVLFARSVVLSPEVLILDDPSAMVASLFLPEVLRWIALQRTKGCGILVGTNDFPVGLAVADWVLHPTRMEAVTVYDDFIDEMWIRSAALLTEKGRVA